MAQVKNYQNACKVLGKNPDVRPDHSMLSEKDRKYYDTKYEMDVIAAAIRGEWVADYSNEDEQKWRPWFIWDDSLSAFRFHDACYSYSASYAGSGSRQVFETKKDAIYYGEKFIDQHNIILTQ